MENWNEIRETYSQGGITQRELAEKFGVPLSTLRRRAAEEKWSRIRSQRRRVGKTDVLARQLAITDRLLDAVCAALDNPDELFTYAEFQKSQSGAEFVCQRLPVINEARLGRLVKAVGDIFELQRIALQIPAFKEQHDAECAARKLELELMKLENSAGARETICDDGFMEALGAAVGDEDEID